MRCVRASWLLIIPFFALFAADGCLVVQLAELTLSEGTLEGPDAPEPTSWGGTSLLPHVVIDQPGEAVIFQDRLAVATTAGPLTGTAWLPDNYGRALHRVRFSTTVPSATPAALTQFSAVRAQVLQGYVTARIPGGAWFRHQLGVNGTTTQAPSSAWRANDELDEMYGLFSGTRALAENLQLDQVLVASAEPAGAPVAVSGIAGITVEEFDWQPLLAGVPPATHPLAALVPADQHLILFPSYAAMSSLIESSDTAVGGLIRGLTPVAEESGLVARYQRQLCLEPSLLAKALGGQVIDAVAITGGDASLRLGSDVAVLFATKQPAILQAVLVNRQQAAMGEPGVERRAGQFGSRTWQGVVSPDRNRCAYMADFGDGRVVVTNSLGQLERLAAVADGRSQALAATPEFRFFRHRYAATQGALVIVTDAAIRRWCSPRLRIGEARRIQALAALFEVQARQIGTGVPDATAIAAVPSLLGICHAERFQVRSERYGAVGFMTPVAELDIEQATAAEAAAYEGFRSIFERRWNGWFDPIGIAVSDQDGQLSCDLTVMPLMADSDYSELISLTRGGKLKPNAGDQHPGAWAHLILAFDRTSERFGAAEDFLSMDGSGFGADPLSWLDGSVALFADEDPLWQELAATEGIEDFFERNITRIPIGLHLGVGNGLRLAAFMTAARTYLERTAPGTVLWEVVEIAGKSCVRLSPVQSGQGFPDNLVAYLLPGPDGVLISLSQTLIERAIARQVQRPAPTSAPWLGEHMGLRVTAGLRPLWHQFGELGGLSELQALAWANLPILNAWHRNFPDEDPVAVHERLWQTRLICPGGGRYVWNPALASMESTVYGSPMQPKAPAKPWTPMDSWSAADFGLTFEHDGVRARAVLTRDKP